MHRQRAHDCDALLLTAGKLPGVGLRPVGKADALKQYRRFVFCLALGKMAKLDRGKGDVLHHVQVREQVELLENHAHFLAVDVDIHRFVGYVRPFENYLSGRWEFQKIQTAQKGGLAGAGRPDNHDDLALFNACGDAVDRDQVAEFSWSDQPPQ
jgi:hypothetical protein